MPSLIRKEDRRIRTFKWLIGDPSKICRGPCQIDPADPLIKFSIIFPTFERKDGALPFDPLSTLLTALLEQADSMRDFEVIIVQDGQETSAVRALVESSRKALNIRYEATGSRHPVGWLRNRGLELSRGQTIVMMDDDALLAPDFLKKLLEVAAQPEFEGSFILTRWLPRYGLRKERYQYTLAFPYSSQCVIYSRIVAQKIGGYFPFLRALEDIDFAIRAIGAEVRVYIAPDLHYYHAPFHFKLLSMRSLKRGRIQGTALRGLARVYPVRLWFLMLLNEIKNIPFLLLPWSRWRRSYGAVSFYALLAWLWPDTVGRPAARDWKPPLQMRLLKMLDATLGRFLVRIFPPPGKNRTVVNLNRILILRPGGLGDAFLLRPMMLILRKAYPKVDIEVLAEGRNAPAFEMSEGLKVKVRRYDSPIGLLSVLIRRYDLVIDTEQWYRLSAVIARLVRTPIRHGFSTNERKRLFTHPVPYRKDVHESENFLRLLEGLEGVRDRGSSGAPFIHLKQAQAKSPPGPKSLDILIAPGSGYPEKLWPMERYRELVQRFKTRGYTIGIIGSGIERKLAAQISNGIDVENLAGRTSLLETAQWIAQSSLLICSDSSVLHIAYGLGRPAVALFGPTPVDQWAPPGQQWKALHRVMPCSPCSSFGHIPPCPFNVGCMRGISVDEVMEAADDLLRQTNSGTKT